MKKIIIFLFIFILLVSSVSAVDFIVTLAGTGVWNGDYTQDGTFNSKPTYKNAVGDYWIWAHSNLKWVMMTPIAEGPQPIYDGPATTTTPDDLSGWNQQLGDLPVPTVTAAGETNPPYYNITDWVGDGVNTTGSTFYFNVTWKDDVGLNHWILSENQTGTWVNSTPSKIWTNIGNGWNISVMSFIINSIKGTVIGLIAYANDTSDNWNNTYLQQTGYGIDNFTMTVLNSGPTIPNITYPINNSNITALFTNVSFNFSSSDADDDTITYSVYINGTLNMTTTGNVTGFNASDGFYNLTVSASDGTVESDNSSSTFFTLDSTAPTVTIIYPTDGLTVSSIPVDLNASAADNRVSTFTYYWVINGTINRTTTDTNSSFNASDGNYNLTVFVFDGLQNGSDTIFFTLDTTPPPPPTITGTTANLLRVGLMVIIAIAMLVTLALPLITGAEISLGYIITVIMVSIIGLIALVFISNLI